MFTGRPLPPLPAPVANAAWAAGFIYNCRQGALDFGSDRHEPVKTRPVVELRRDGARFVVLPATSQSKGENLNFFELAAHRTEWVRPNSRSSFVYYRYETVLPDDLYGKKIGAMSHPSRIDLMTWLKERY